MVVCSMCCAYAQMCCARHYTQQTANDKVSTMLNQAHTTATIYITFAKQAPLCLQKVPHANLNEINCASDEAVMPGYIKSKNMYTNNPKWSHKQMQHISKIK